VIDAGWVGSPADVATLLVAFATLRKVREDQSTGHAVITALSESIDEVDHERVRSALNVEERHSRQFLDE